MILFLQEYNSLVPLRTELSFSERYSHFVMELSEIIEELMIGRKKLIIIRKFIFCFNYEIY